MRKIITTFLIIFSFGLILPEPRQIPVKGATVQDWYENSFWYYPWGRSGVHKGIDIFAKQGTPVVSATGGFILYSGDIPMGGNVVYMIGPKWRFHYYAHLEKTHTHRFGFVDVGQQIGTVGSTGNAAGKPPHLHYSIKSLFPRFWKFQPEKKSAVARMFFIDPSNYLLKNRA